MEISKLAEINVENFSKKDLKWIKNNSTFSHNEKYVWEHIIHLYLDQTEEWFKCEILNKNISDHLNKLILSARRAGAARICFYI